MSDSANAISPHLLVVDDDADMLRLLTMRLTAAGYRVTAVTSAEAALTQLHIERPQLVLSDVRLPGRDGLALFDDIRQQHPSLPVILLTAHGTIPDAVEATERGVFTYLTKPFDGKGLLDKIAQALALSADPPPRQTGQPRSLAKPDHQPLQPHGRSAGRSAHGGAVRRQRAAARRKRHRQGAAGPSHPPGRRTRQQALHRGQLRRHS
jgi:DNA-binding NtrC family response regulator